MTRRLKAPQRRAKRVARLARESGPPDFNLGAVASRSAGETGLPARPWSGDDMGFLSAVLDAHHLPPPLIQRLVAAAATLPLTARLIDRLTAALADRIHFSEFREVLRAPVLLLAGPPGAGKTTLAAKLAAHLGERRALLISTDAARAGGMAQLEEYADVLGLAVPAAADAIELGRLVSSANGRSIIIDTTGVTPGDEAARTALARLIAASAAQPLLVLPADIAASEAAAMVAFYAPLGATTLLATRLDLAQRMGGMLAAAAAGRLAVPAAGMTPHFAYGLVALSPGMLARRLLAPALSGVPL